ncbi:MAG: MBL fold metallo-hydrolase [Spirochaetes bacterium]|nr:MBL fold metallo-hydrolase [Spirochaetota bacterium]
MMKSQNYDGKKFVNPIPVKVMQQGSFFGTAWKWIAGDEKRQPQQPIGPFKLDPDQFNSMDSSGLRVTWINHSTVIIEIDGKRFITDPVWSKRASPVSFAGPKRFFEPPIKVEDLPPLDGVIISHDHYDHLDENTIKKIAKTGVHFYMPLGVGKHFDEWDVNEKHIHEFDWWETVKIDDAHILVATPACHFSGRGLFNRNQTLWSSWVILGKKHKVYFGGDSGYFPGFKQIGEKYGPFDITMLEIGAYHPNWGSIHLGPENAVKAHIDLKGKVMLPIHWGTFTLAFHGWTDPVEQLLVEAKSKQIKLMLPGPGQSVYNLNVTLNSEWWKQQEITKANKLIEAAD